MSHEFLKSLGVGAAAVGAGDFLGAALSSAVPAINVGGMPVAKYVAAVGGAYVGLRFIMGDKTVKPMAALIMGVVCMAGADVKTSVAPTLMLPLGGWDVTRALAGAGLAVLLKNLGVGAVPVPAAALPV